MTIQEEAKLLIAVYEANGWDWTDALAFLLACHVGIWPPRCARCSSPRRSTKGVPRK